MEAVVVILFYLVCLMGFVAATVLALLAGLFLLAGLATLKLKYF